MPRNKPRGEPQEGIAAGTTGSDVRHMIRQSITEMADNKKIYPDIKSDVEKTRSSKRNQSKAQKNTELKSEENGDDSKEMAYLEEMEAANLEEMEMADLEEMEIANNYDQYNDEFINKNNRIIHESTPPPNSNLRPRTRERKEVHKPISPRDVQSHRIKWKYTCESALPPIKNQPPFSPEKKHTQRKVPETSLFSWIHKYIMIIIPALLIFLVPAGIWFSKQTTDTSAQFYVSTLMSNLKHNFEEQPDMTFRIVRSAIKNVIETDPKAPAIIILLASKGAESVSEQFARQIVESISKPTSFVSIRGQSFRMEDPDVAKKDIDDIINENLTEGELRAVWVDRLDYIPAEAALIFHTYCDHENAPFKKAVYVMTVSLDKTVPEDSPKDWDVMLQEHLYTVWSTAGNDQISSLLSRLTVSVAAIVPKQ